MARLARTTRANKSVRMDRSSPKVTLPQGNRSQTSVPIVASFAETLAVPYRLVRPQQSPQPRLASFLPAAGAWTWLPSLSVELNAPEAREIILSKRLIRRRWPIEDRDGVSVLVRMRPERSPLQNAPSPAHGQSD